MALNRHIILVILIGSQSRCDGCDYDSITSAVVVVIGAVMVVIGVVIAVLVCVGLF